jgi:hypothetical protein
MNVDSLEETLSQEKNALEKQQEALSQRNILLEAKTKQYDFSRLRISQLDKIEKDLGMIQFYQRMKLIPNFTWTGERNDLNECFK